jgi:anaerobic magnesium-protoporphyrin IX monomethyl ester cyclase
MYSPLQFAPGEQAKPDGSLSLAYVASALRNAGYDVKILDVSVGNEKDTLETGFFNNTNLDTGLVRAGISEERIAEEVAEADVVGISSIFTPQTKMVFELSNLVKKIDPNKLVLSGGVNARNLRDRFFANGVDLIVLSEAELTILELAEWIRGKRELNDVAGIVYLDADGKEHQTGPGRVIMKLDELPMPAWDMLPLDKYWDISRPHGGQFDEGQRIKYASLQTSRGCPYQCLYCHISKEIEGSLFGNIGQWRPHSIERVLEELHVLNDLGAEYIFFEDDSLFAKKKRAYKLFSEVAKLGLKLADVNGINIIHLMKNTGKGGKLGIDHEFLEILAAAGFTWLTLPFESGNERLVEKYSSGKWNLEKTDTKALIEACSRVGIRTVGNYMMGYPDETLDEIYTTILMAKQHVEQGLNHALFFDVMPFPGTALYDTVIKNGQLDKDFDPDGMKWTKSILKNTAVSADALSKMRQLAWLTVNRSDFVDYKIGQRVDTPETM